MIKQIGLPLSNRPILLITHMITDQIELRSVLLPLFTAWKTSVYHYPFITGLPAKWRLTNELTNSMLMTHTTQIWVVLLIGCAMWEICFSQQKHYPDLAAVWIFCTCFSDGETRKCLLFSQATLLIYSSLYAVWRNCTSQLLNMWTIFPFQVAG